MKNLSFKTALLTLLLLIVANTMTVFAAEVPIYRVFNPRSNEHLFTVSPEEVGALTSQGWNDEGTAWIAPGGDQAGVAPVYRLYNPMTALHLYTTDQNEANVLTSQQGWQKDFNGEPIFFSGGYTPIYRLYSDKSFDHHLTTDSYEYWYLPQSNFSWKPEGASLYALRATISNVPETTDPNAGITFNNPNNVDLLVNQYDQSYYNKLNEIERQNYNNILSALRNVEPSVEIHNLLTVDEVFRVYHAVTYDHPEIFYISPDISYDHLGKLIFSYLISNPEEIAQKQAEINDWANAALSTVNPSNDQKDIAQDLHNFINGTTNYDFNNLDLPINQTLLSVVQNRNSVCKGYTCAYNYLLNRAGIFSTCVVGNLQGIPHAWTLHNLDGQYSYTDVTNDENTDGSPRLKLDHFSMRKSRMTATWWEFNTDYQFPD